MKRRLYSLACAALALAPIAARADGITDIAVDAQSIIVTLDPADSGRTALVEQPVYAERDPADAPRVWTGPAGERTVTIPRFDGPRDRLYARFAALDPDTGAPRGAPRYVTDLSRLDRRTEPMPRPTTKKGLQAVTDFDDATALGLGHVTLNVSLVPLHDATGTSELFHTVDGQPVHINARYLQHVDAFLRRAHGAQMRVYLIIAVWPGAGSPLVHPGFDGSGTIAAFNLTDETGLRVYRGLLEFLAERYSRPSSAADGSFHGHAAGYIIGNEINSHQTWFNLGPAPHEQVIEHYARALRVADLAVRRYHAEPRVYVSLEHHWTVPYVPDPLRATTGKRVLDDLAALVKREGDFPWDIAFHPYPENLFNPRTWADQSAVHRFDTPRITFRNVEVLPAYIERPALRYAGAPRRIILSEQGLNAPDTPGGEALQAAGLAFASYRIDRIPGIDAFIYHRDTDHAHEGGLRLGLRENKPGTIATPGRKRRAYDVFKAAGSDGWRDAFDFALPLIGIERWEEAGPRPVAE